MDELIFFEDDFNIAGEQVIELEPPFVVNPELANDEPRRGRRRRAAEETPEELAFRRDNERRMRIAARDRRLTTSAIYRAAIVYDKTYDYCNDVEVNIGRMSRNCIYCDANTFSGESEIFCCKQGRINRPLIPDPPEPLFSLLSRETEESRHFMRFPRDYNNCFQMTSFGAREVNNQWSTFSVTGQVYHLMGSILPESNRTPAFAQIYFVGDESVELDCRNLPGTNCRRDILAHLQLMLHNGNHIVRQFRSNLDSVNAAPRRLVIHSERTPQGQHPRRWNAPQETDCAAVIIDGDKYSGRDIVLEYQSGALTRINELHQSYDALQYPLIFWQGNSTYDINLKEFDVENERPADKSLSMCSYYRYLFQLRNSCTNHLLRYGQLSNQLLVDAAAKVENSRLQFIANNQAQLRAADYIHLRDAIRQDGDPEELGVPVILPSSFQGGPRHRHEYVQDALAVTRIKGKPTFFITMTANPSWPEIVDNVPPGAKATERHDLIARVFNLKSKKLVELLHKKWIFGKSYGYTYSIEWQKRGLPHMHLLHWLDDEISVIDYDKVICAEFPNPEEDPLLFQLVLRCMIHKCRSGQNGCIRDGKCIKGFPKRYQATTIMPDGGYPLYRRRSPEQGGFFYQHEVNGEIEIITNEYVVPYNPTLLKAFQCHMNVEICVSIDSIQYLFKYIHKGADAAIVSIEGQQPGPRNEVRIFREGRYLSTNEAIWMIFKFALHGRFPNTVALDIHLENGQRVYFTRNNAAIIAQNPPATKLTAFFSLCRDDAFARTRLYSEIPSYYKWDVRTKEWAMRLRGEPVEGWIGRKSATASRMYSIHPRHIECFHLRILLLNRRGPTSYDDLKTVDGVLHQTFKDACIALHLLDDDSQWRLTMREGANCQNPRQLRELFVMLVYHSAPSNIPALLEEFMHDLSADFRHDLQRNAVIDFERDNIIELSTNRTLIALDDLFQEFFNTSLLDYGLPMPVRSSDELIENEPPEVLRERNYNQVELRRMVRDRPEQLNVAQQAVYDVLRSRIDAGQGGLFFIDAPAGTGKTFLINLILAHTRLQGKIAIAVASSGIAATLIEGAKTAHTTFNLKLDKRPPCSCYLPKHIGKAKVLAKCSVIIWDECTMTDKVHFEAVDKSLQDLRGSSEPMGGVLFILAGDFRQTLPITQGASDLDTIRSCINYSQLWNEVTTLRLFENMRALRFGDEGAEFARTVLSIGDDTIGRLTGTDQVNFPDGFYKRVDNLEQMISCVFPDLTHNISNAEWLAQRAILSTTNAHARVINHLMLGRMNARSRVYKSIDSLIDLSHAVTLTTELLNSRSPNGFPEHSLELKIGAPIILLRNLSPPKLCNGTRLIVLEMQNHIIKAKIMGGKYAGLETLIPKIGLDIVADLTTPYKRIQFPVKLAFAMTINKSQGQSLDSVGVYLRDPVFSHGQLYVACSRVGNPDNLYIYMPPGCGRNIVYQAVLRR